MNQELIVQFMQALEDHVIERLKEAIKTISNSKTSLTEKEAEKQYTIHKFSSDLTTRFMYTKLTCLDMLEKVKSNETL